MTPLASFEGAVIGAPVCAGKVAVTQEDIDRFCRLLGYDHPAYRGTDGGGGVAPPSMGLTYGLRLGWEEDVFPPGAIRVGDEVSYGVPARAGDLLTTTLRIVERFERKGRKFLKYEMATRNQSDALVCCVAFTAIVP